MSKNEQKFLGIILSFLFIFLIFVIYFVFSGRLILPQTFSFGSLTIRYYGLFMALAVASGYYLAKKRAEKFGLEPKTVDEILFWLIIGGFVGARLYHVFSSFGYYFHQPLEIIKVWHGGLSIYGAVLGGLLAVFFLATNYKLQTTNLLNWLTPSLILGQIIGRFGNLFNYEAFGYPTNLPWKMFVPFEFRPSVHQIPEFFHPWFLYEQIGLIIVFVIIRKIKKYPPFSSPPNLGGGGVGGLFFYYLLLYNILRFVLEFLRIDSVMIGSLRLNALTSLGLIIISAIMLNKQKKTESV